MRVVIDISEYDKEWIGNAYGIPQEINTKIAEAIINAEPCHPEPHWIPVEQALPEDDTVVLVCGKSGGIYTAIHNNSKAWIRGWWKMNSKNHYCNPTAWMPLPEPYNGVTT